MGLWKDHRTGTWKYSFVFQGHKYRGAAFPSKADARTAQEERRKQVRMGIMVVGSVQETPKTDMAFLRLADLYLDLSQRRHAPKTFKYKRYVYASFLHHCGDENLTVDKITPYLMQHYLHTRESNSNSNRHRKDLAALFEYARRVLGIVAVNPCGH
jgi:hypothetical protein